LKVVVLLLPAGMLPVSHAPVSLVEVCAMLELLFQVIVEFTAIVSIAGLNEFPAIVIVFVFAGGLLDDVPAGLEELSLHPIILMSNIPAVMMKKLLNSLCIMNISVLCFAIYFQTNDRRDKFHSMILHTNR
jgi:hypothetical protein